MSSEETQYKFYLYNPSLPASIIFTIIFSLLILWQIYQLFSSITLIISSHRSSDLEKQNPFKDPYGHNDPSYRASPKYIAIMIPFILGLCCELVGYIGRIMSHNNISDMTPYVMQTLLILVGPPLLSATIYMVFGRIVTKILGNEQYLLIRSKFITKICVVGDVLSLALQGIGGGILTGAQDNQDRFNLGRNVILFGLAVQILFFGFFMVVELTYFIRLLNNLESSDYNINIISDQLRYFPSKFNHWKTLLCALFVSSLFILMRSIYRVVEFTEDAGGYTYRNEWLIYVFDGLMIFFSCAIFMSQDISNYFIKTIPETIGKY